MPSYECQSWTLEVTEKKTLQSFDGILFKIRKLGSVVDYINKCKLISYI